MPSSSVQLSAPLADGGTVTFAYPSGTSAGSFASANGHVLKDRGTKWTSPHEFTVSFGVSNITVTYGGGETIPKATVLTLDLDAIGEEDADPALAVLTESFVTVKSPPFNAAADGDTDDTDAIDAAEAYAEARGGGVVRFPSGPYVMTNGAPPAGVTRRYEGAIVDRTQLGGAANFKSHSASYTYIDGPHETHQVSADYIRALAKGSGAIGAQYADYALALHIQKEHWSETSGTPAAGEIDGLTIQYRQGGPRVGSGDPLEGISSGAAILCNVQATQGSGASQILESVNTVVDVPGLTINRNIGCQIGMINTRDDDYYGLVLISNVGTQDAAIKVDSVSGSSWGRILESVKGAVTNYYIDVDANHRWRTTGGTNIFMTFDDASGELVFKNNSNAEVFRVGQTRVTAKPYTANVQTGTTYTITESDHDRAVVLANAGAITAELSATASVGTRVSVTQRDSGQVTFTPASGATLRNRQSHTKTAGQYARVYLEVLANGGGSAAIWYLSGDTAA